LPRTPTLESLWQSKWYRLTLTQIYNKNAKEEIAMHKKLEHHNIVRLLNYYMEKERNITYMVLEYVDGGSLFEKVRSHQLTKPLIRQMFR
jgi:serine/threonine protein kinase